MESNQPYQMSDFTSPAPKKKSRAFRILLIVVGAIVALCLGGGVIAAVANNNNSNKAASLPLVVSTPDPTPSVSPFNAGPEITPETTNPTTRLTTPPATTKAAPAPARISGDDVVHVGSDVPAGVYRTTTKVDPEAECYWKKSSDAEGDDIIDNNIVKGGRPQVTLKKGQWFTTEDCPDWTKQGK